MIKVKDVAAWLENVAPLSLQEHYDNSGLIVGTGEDTVTGILISLDITEDVVNEAIQKSCNLIIAHHPVVFSGLKKFNGSTYVERVVMRAICEKISLYAIHTNLDNVRAGVSGKMAEKIGLKNTEILAPKPGDLSGETGFGIIGEINVEVEEKEFLQQLKRQMNTQCIRHTKLLGKKVKKVAVCGGAGGFLLKDAIRQGADVFVTGDYKYHHFFDAENKIVIADIGHYESEQFTVELIGEILSKKFSTFAPLYTAVNTNPINYL